MKYGSLDENNQRNKKLNLDDPVQIIYYEWISAHWWYMVLLGVQSKNIITDRRITHGKW